MQMQHAREDAGSGPASDSRLVPALYQEHAKFVRRLVFLFRVPLADREDVQQAVWMVVHRRADTFESGTSARAWLAAIVRRCVADARRSRTRRAWEVERDEVEYIVARGVDVERWFGALDFLYSAVPDEHVREVWLLDFEGFTAAEIAKVTGAPITTVEHRLKVARKQLTQAQMQRQQTAGALVPLTAPFIELRRVLQNEPIDTATTTTTELAVNTAPRVVALAARLAWPRIAVAALAVFIGGAVAGVLADRALQPAPRVESVVVAVHEAPVEVLSPAGQKAEAPAAVALLVEASARPSSSSSSSPTRPARPRPEAADMLLMRARAALASSPSEALAILTEHTQRFPHLHTAERATLEVRALVRLGRTEEAETKASAALRASASYRSVLETAVGHALP